MRIEQTFTVEAEADTVFVALNDVEQVTPCMAGARIVARHDDGRYDCELNVGFTRLRGTLGIGASDPVARTLELTTAHHSAHVVVVPRAGVSDVTIAADVPDIGSLMLLGGFAHDLAGRMLRDFGTCLSSKLGPA